MKIESYEEDGQLVLYNENHPLAWISCDIDDLGV